MPPIKIQYNAGRVGQLNTSQSSKFNTLRNTNPLRARKFLRRNTTKPAVGTGETYQDRYGTVPSQTTDYTIVDRANTDLSSVSSQHQSEFQRIYNSQGPNAAVAWLQGVTGKNYSTDPNAGPSFTLPHESAAEGIFERAQADLVNVSPAHQDAFRRIFDTQGQNAAVAWLSKTTGKNYSQAPGTGNPVAPEGNDQGLNLLKLLANPDQLLGDITASPFYKFQQEEGEEAIGRALSSTGHRLGGARVKAVSDFSSKLLGEETERQRSDVRGRVSNIMNLALEDARAQERISNEDFNRVLQLIDRFTKNDPTAEAIQAGGASADLFAGLGRTEMDVLKQMFARPTLGVGPAGSAGSAPPYIQPFPSAPDMSDLAIIAELAGQGNRDSTSNLLSEFIAGLLK